MLCNRAGTRQSVASAPSTQIATMAAAGVWYFADASELDDTEQRTPTTRSTPGLTDVQRYSLGAALLCRPAICVLEERGIVRSPTALTADKLEGKFRRRPSREEVIESGVLVDKGEKVTTAVKRLARRSLCDALENGLQKRPSREQMMEEGLIHALTKKPLASPASRDHAELAWQFGAVGLPPPSPARNLAARPWSPPRTSQQFGYPQRFGYCPYSAAETECGVAQPLTSEYIDGGYF